MAFGLLLAATGCADGSQDRHVTIMVPWSGYEFKAFYSVIRDFEKEYGVSVDVEVTRALTLQLDPVVAGGTPPDLAVLPSVGAIDKYAQDGPLKALDKKATKAYVQPFRDLAMVGDKVYAVPVKADVKSLTWYNPALGERSGARRWCLNLSSGPTSGWPGADWIADQVLVQENGDDTYRRWLTGKQSWKEISDAWTSWRNLVAASTDGADTRQPSEIAGQLTRRPPQCTSAHGTLSSLGYDPKAHPGRAYDFEKVPRGRPLQVSADFIGRFTDNRDADKLITYLSGKAAQQAWVKARGGYAISANRDVPPEMYRNRVQRRISELLMSSAHTLCFSAADTMRPDVSTAFYRAVLAYTAEEKELDGLLTRLDAVKDEHAGHSNSLIPPEKICSA